jgi:hypothetical protein
MDVTENLGLYLVSRRRLVIATMSSILSPIDVMGMGLAYIGVSREQQAKMSAHNMVEDFNAHFGSSPLVIASIWYDLCHTSIPEAQLEEKEKTEKGFKRYMIAHFFLWAYPKNANLTKTRFKICRRYLEGNELWYWPTKIGALKATKIVWSQDLDSHNTEIIAISVDGVNYSAWEKKHPTLNKDPAFYDHKHNSCGYKYEIGLRIYEPKIAWIKGPVRGGKGDRDIFREDGLKDKLASTPGKMGIADGGYEMRETQDKGFLCLPNTMDSRELKHFKSRARCRHETLNGRLNNFKILQDKFRHGMKCHGIAFEAVAVIIQYQMDNGAPIFDV